MILLKGSCNSEFSSRKKRNQKLMRRCAIWDPPGNSSLSLSQGVLRNLFLQYTGTRCCCTALAKRVVGTDKDSAGGGGGSQRAVARFLSFSLKTKQNPSTLSVLHYLTHVVKSQWQFPPQHELHWSNFFHSLPSPSWHYVSTARTGFY